MTRSNQYTSSAAWKLADVSRNS